MARNSRCMGAAAAVASMCLGLAGCMNSLDNEPSVFGSSAYGSGGPNNSAYPGQMASVNDPRGYVQQAGFPPKASYAPNSVMTQPGETVVEHPGMGAPMPMGPGGPGGHPIPTEKAMSSNPPHRVAPPDTLYIEALRLAPRGPYLLQPLEILAIEVPDTTLPKQEIRGNFLITPEGTVNLGYNYGSVRVGGLTLDQAQQAIREHLSNIIKNPTVNVALVQLRGQQNIRGEHLVRPDGTIHLGMYGTLYVAGMTLGQIKGVLERHLSAYLIDPQVSVDVMAYNSRKIYVIADGGGYGQQIIPVPATGNDTVLDVISRVQGLPSVSSQKKIWVARPSPAGYPCSSVLPVNWEAIVQGGRTETNYQLFPGDRVYIAADPWITLYNTLDKVLSPIERVLGVTLLGATTYQTIAGTIPFGVVR